ncbi:Do family serine endopeptidase [Rubripirellula amarantea]|nr:Do family serine endopeptidase [Rubripirellula amarantea]
MNQSIEVEIRIFTLDTSTGQNSMQETLTKSTSTRTRRTRLAALVLALTTTGVAVSGFAIGESKVDLNKPRPSIVQNLSPDVQRALNNASGLSTAFRAVSESLLPSVVAIENRVDVAKTVSKSNGSTQPSADPFAHGNPFKGTPFEDFFSDKFDGNAFPMPHGKLAPRQLPKRMPSSGIGSGVVIDESGIILTNNHVVEGGGKVVVRTADGTKYEATAVWTDPSTDIAVVKIEGATDLVAASLGDSDQMGIGDWVLALGQPFGLDSTVTAGIISAKNRGIHITDRENFLQTDAAINPGNSGGPLVNLKGEVIGINTAIHSRSGGNEGIGFAVPSNMARWVASQLIDNGKVQRAYLGVGIQPATYELAKQMNVKPNSGVVVTDVFPDTPAAEVGLESGDVIVKFDGQPVRKPLELQLLVERCEVGKKFPVEIVRNGKTIELSYTATSRPDEFGSLQASSSASQSDSPSVTVSDWGVEVADVNSSIANQLGVQEDSGVVVTSVMDGSAAAEAGLEPGIVIKQVDRQAVDSVAELKQKLAEADDDVLLLVRTKNGSQFIVMTKS